MAKYQVRLKVNNCLINEKEIGEGVISKVFEASNPDDVLNLVSEEIKQTCANQNLPVFDYKVVGVRRVKDEK